MGFFGKGIEWNGLSVSYTPKTSNGVFGDNTFGK